MSIPKQIPVAWSEFGYSKYIGQYADRNQFWARVAANMHNSSYEDFQNNTWRSKKRWYAILHKFDSDGNHIETQAEFIGTTADGEDGVLDRAKAKMEDFIDHLDKVRYGDIAISLFEVNIDECLFGLVDTSDESGVTVSMIPGDLVFYPPWDGNYDT